MQAGRDKLTFHGWRSAAPLKRSQIRQKEKFFEDGEGEGRGGGAEPPVLMAVSSRGSAFPPLLWRPGLLSIRRRRRAHQTRAKVRAEKLRPQPQFSGVAAATRGESVPEISSEITAGGNKCGAGE